MTSDSLNTDRDMSESVPDRRHRTSRYVSDYDLDTESDLESVPARVDWKPAGNSSSETDMSLTPYGMVWPGIVFASACYPVIFGVGIGVYGTLALGLPMLDFGLVLGLLIASFSCGMISGAIMSVPAFLLTQLWCWSFNGIVSTRGAIAIFGGMTGFLCMFCGGMFYTQGMPANLEWQVVVIMFLSLLLAVVMGYLGAILAGFLARYDDFPFFEPIIYLEKQLTIPFLFRLTLMVAVLTAIFSAAGLYVGITWLAYLLVQLFLLVCDHWITRWLHRFSRTKYRVRLTSGRR